VSGCSVRFGGGGFGFVVVGGVGVCCGVGVVWG